MTLLEAIKERHTVRAYLDKEIEVEKVQLINEEIENCNRAGDLNFQLVLNEPKAFSYAFINYGRFSNVKNYIACIGKKSDVLLEKVGYYGEKLVLYLQTLGLNTCWTVLTFKQVPGCFKINEGEKLVCVIALGYGENQGKPHKIKKYEDVCDIKNPPIWFRNGVEASLLAPTSINQQKFFISLDKENKPIITRKGLGFYTKIDLGIVKYHFEIGSKEK